MAGETDNFGLILGWYDCMEQERTWFEIIKSYLKEQLRWIHSLLSRSTFNRVKFQAISSSPSNSESSEATYIWQRLTKHWKNDEEMALRSLVAFSSMSWIYWNLFLQRWISGETTCLMESVWCLVKQFSIMQNLWIVSAYFCCSSCWIFDFSDCETVEFC